MISVAMATFNGDTYIQEQLDSIYNQTRKVDEIIIVDDGSKDEESLKELALNEENVKKHILDKEIVIVIVIKGKVVNIVVK